MLLKSMMTYFNGTLMTCSTLPESRFSRIQAAYRNL